MTSQKVFWTKETLGNIKIEVVESTGKIRDEFWEVTNKGLLFRANLFHIDELPKLTDLANRITAKNKELSDLEAEIYKIKR